MEVIYVLHFVCDNFRFHIRGCSIPGEHKAKKSHMKKVRKLVAFAHLSFSTFLEQCGKLEENSKTQACPQE